MDSSLHINPYFDPQPQIFFIGLKVNLVITIMIASIQLFLLFFKSPPHKSKVFRGLLAYHVIIASLMNLYISTLAIPIPYLPYLSVSFVGILTDMNVPTVAQFAILVNIVVSAATGISPLFYYRMDSLLPPGHFLDKTLFRLAFYAFVYGFCQIIPIPLIAIAYAYQDQDELKREELNIHRVYFEKYWSDRMIIAKMGMNNPFVILIFLLIIGACALAVSYIIFCVLFIYHIINKSTKVLSQRNKKMQKNSLVALISLMGTLFFGLGVIIPTIVIIFTTNSYRQDILNVVILLGLNTLPAASVAYIATYKPYRRYILKMFCRVKISTSENSLWATEKFGRTERRQTVFVPM